MLNAMWSLWWTHDPEYKRWRQAVVDLMVDVTQDDEGQSTKDGDTSVDDLMVDMTQDSGKDGMFDPTDFEYTDEQGTVRRSLEDDKMAPKPPQAPQAPQAPPGTKAKDDTKMLTDADLEAMIE